jgi:hypothetical protein
MSDDLKVTVNALKPDRYAGAPEDAKITFTSAGRAVRVHVEWDGGEHSHEFLIGGTNGWPDQVEMVAEVFTQAVGWKVSPA